MRRSYCTFTFKPVPAYGSHLDHKITDLMFLVGIPFILAFVIYRGWGGGGDKMD